MADYDYWGDEEESKQYQHHQNREQRGGQGGLLDQMFTTDDAMNAQRFRVVEHWAEKQFDFTGLKDYVGAGSLLLPLSTYTHEKLEWLDENFTNSVEIDSQLQQAKKLQQWVDRQPASSLFSWLPTFEKLKLTKDSSTEYDEDANDTITVTSKSQIFIFRKKVFFLSKGRTQRRHNALTLRCMWFSNMPIFDLLAAARSHSQLVEEAPLMITTVWHGSTERDEGVKRPLSLIDMEPKTKAWILNGLKKFFAKDSMAYYRMNGTPYRRGYLLYGPPGTGKTSLAQAIASDYDLELFKIKLGKMTDSTLQRTFKSLPPRCVVLFEDIDAAGIGREDLIQAEVESKKAKESERANSNYQRDYDDDYEANPEAYCQKHDIEIKPEQSFVTLSGLLNALDGPGTKEGRFVILTTNSPKTLDKAVTRKGRMNKILYLGYSCPGSAAATFMRMFGTDRTFHIPPNELERLARRFARKIPKDMFTPCEISDYCREHRGEPQEAIK